MSRFSFPYLFYLWQKAKAHEPRIHDLACTEKILDVGNGQGRLNISSYIPVGPRILSNLGYDYQRWVSRVVLKWMFRDRVQIRRGVIFHQKILPSAFECSGRSSAASVYSLRVRTLRVSQHHLVDFHSRSFSTDNRLPIVIVVHPSLHEKEQRAAFQFSALFSRLQDDFRLMELRHLIGMCCPQSCHNCT